jgi:HSP20 family molecular chaperone IbpA
MYSCSQLAKLLAMKRGLDPEGTVVQYEEGLLIVCVPMIGKEPFKNIKPIEIK